MTRLMARFNDFSKGESGWNDKQRIQPGYFTGESVQVFRDGTVGPRAGIIPLGATGWPGGTTNILDMGYIDLGNAGDEYVWIRTNAKLCRLRVYQQTGSISKVVTGQALSVDVTGFAVNGFGDHVDYEKAVTLFTIQGDKSYKAVWTNAPTTWLSVIAGSPGGGTCEIYGDFFVVGNVPSHPNRLVFSAQQNYASWPAANFLDLGNVGNAGAGGAPTITAIRKVKDQLLVFADTGQMWVISGTLGAHSLVIREFMPGDHTNGPGAGRAITRDRAGGVWWTRREDIVAEGQTWDNASAMPVSYLAGVRGEVPDQAGYLRQVQFASNRVSDTLGFTPRNDKSAVLMDRAAGGEMRALIYRDGVWTRHRLEFDTTTAIQASTPGSRGDVYMGLFNASVLPTIYAWQAEYEQPVGVAFATNSLLLPLNYRDSFSDGSNTPIDAWFATPEYREPSGGTVNVERVDVFYSSQITIDGVTPNTMQLYVQQYDVAGAAEREFTIQNPEDYDATGGPPGAYNPPFGTTIPLGPAVSDIPTPGDWWRRRVSMYPESGQDKPSLGFRVLVKNMLNVKVHEIAVYGTITAPARR